MGSVFRQAGRRNWMIRYYRDGRRIDESARTPDRTEAKKLLRQREADIDRGLPLGPKVGRIRFEEAATDITNEYRTNRRRTLGHVERRLRKHLTPFLGVLALSDVRTFVGERQDAEASNAEINRELSVLKRMYTLALEAGKLLHRPHIQMLQEHNVRTGFFERAQFEAVRRHLLEWLRGVVTFAYITGWRIQSEVLPLQWPQIDMAAGTVRLDPGTTKNDEGRVFPFDLMPELQEVIERQRQLAAVMQQDGRIVPWVFHDAGEPLLDRSGRAKHTVRVAWKDACTKAACPGRIPHDFRRTAVRNLTRAGVPERVAMQLTGHKTRSVFDRYDIVNEADLRAAVQRLAVGRG